MNIKKSVCLIAILWFCISQNYGQNINNLDSLSTNASVEKDNFSANSSFLNKLTLSNVMIQKYEPAEKVNFDYLKAYEYKSYNMKKYYLYHGMNTIPGFLMNNYRLPAYIDYQKVEVIKKRR